MDVDYMRSRRCWIEGTLNGYESTQVEISNVNPSTGVNVDLAPITISLKGSNPYALGGPDKDVPSKGSGEWKAAMKAVNANDIPGAVQQLTAATAANPKFALAWHNLGILNDFQLKIPEAREAYAKAIEADPKMLAPYAAMNRLLVREKDWAGVLKTSAAMIPVDKDRIFPELYAFQAAAHFNLKDLAAAQAAANEALNPKAKRTYPRAEYVLGRILEAKGDAAGAKQHMARYLELASSEDAAQIKAHIDAMGTPGAPEPDLVPVTR
jgi:tetratricopeptide (TPR) repeat protein